MAPVIYGGSDWRWKWPISDIDRQLHHLDTLAQEPAGEVTGPAQETTECDATTKKIDGQDGSPSSTAIGTYEHLRAPSTIPPSTRTPSPCPPSSSLSAFSSQPPGSSSPAAALPSSPPQPLPQPPESSDAASINPDQVARSSGFADEMKTAKGGDVVLPPITAWHDIDSDISMPTGVEEGVGPNPYGDIYLRPRPPSSASTSSKQPRLLVGAPGPYEEKIQNVVRPPTCSPASDLSPSDGPKEHDPSENEFRNNAVAALKKCRCWDEDLFRDFRDEAISAGFHRTMESFRGLVLRSTNEVIARSSYIQNDGQTVHIDESNFPMVRWFGERNALTPAADALFGADGSIPPVLCAASAPLDLAMEVANLPIARGRRIVVSFEATDFAADGSLIASVTKPTVQQTFFQRTDFTKYAAVAARQLGVPGKDSRCNTKQHLAAAQDPYIFIAPGVTAFRGNENLGFPFLHQPVKLDVITSATWTDQPDAKGGYYRRELDQAALLQRLNLIGLTAADHQRDEAEDLKNWVKWNPELGDLPKPAEIHPMLIISVPGCIQGGRHPRKAVANSLKHFRLSHARYFSTILVACGNDRDLALEMDQIVNADVYQDYDKEKRIGKWHWDAGLLTFGANGQLDWIGRQGRKIYHESGDDKLEKRISSEDGIDVTAHRRRSSALSILGGALRENTAMQREAEMTYAVDGAKEKIMVAELLEQSSVGDVVNIDTSRSSTVGGAALARRSSQSPDKKDLDEFARRKRQEARKSLLERSPDDELRRGSKDTAPPDESRREFKSMDPQNIPGPPDMKGMVQAAVEKSTRRQSISELAQERKLLAVPKPRTIIMRSPDDKMYDRVQTLANAVSDQINVKLVQNYTRVRDARIQAKNATTNYSKRQHLVQKREYKIELDRGNRSAKLGSSSGRLAAAFRSG